MVGGSSRQRFTDPLLRNLGRFVASELGDFPADGTTYEPTPEEPVQVAERDVVAERTATENQDAYVSA
jgi:hypothetical protein